MKFTEFKKIRYYYKNEMGYYVVSLLEIIYFYKNYKHISLQSKQFFKVLSESLIKEVEAIELDEKLKLVVKNSTNKNKKI